jgi:hypothetical protein
MQRLIPSALLGFLLGILGNLIAAYIERVSLCNAVTSFWIGFVIALTLIGLAAGIWIQIPMKIIWPVNIMIAIILTGLVSYSIWSKDCPYQADNDAKTLIDLIHAEAEAVKQRDSSIIKRIFARDAIIQNTRTGEKWSNPITHYEVLFDNSVFIQAEHFNINDGGITETTAHFTSGSRGKFYNKNNPDSIITYNNPNPSDEWTFGKDICGCWVITNFSFR